MIYIIKKKKISSLSSSSSSYESFTCNFIIIIIKWIIFVSCCCFRCLSSSYLSQSNNEWWWWWYVFWYRFQKKSCNYCLFVHLELNCSFLELPAMSINEFVCLIWFTSSFKKKKKQTKIFRCHTLFGILTTNFFLINGLNACKYCLQTFLNLNNNNDKIIVITKKLSPDFYIYRLPNKTTNKSLSFQSNIKFGKFYW